MWAVKAKTCVKNRLNDARFVLFNTLFPRKYHSAHHVFFKSCSVNLLGMKIANFYQQYWLLISKRQLKDSNGDENSQFSLWFFTFSNNFPKVLCFLAVFRGVNNSMKKCLGMWLLSWEIKPESTPKMQKICFG